VESECYVNAFVMLLSDMQSGVCVYVLGRGQGLFFFLLREQDTEKWQGKAGLPLHMRGLGYMWVPCLLFRY